MARLTPAVVRPSQTGTLVTMGAPNVDGDAIPPNAILLVTNASGGSITLTVDTPGNVGGLAIDQYSATVAAGTTELVGPFRDRHFVQSEGATEGLVHVNYSSQASVTRAVFAASLVGPRSIDFPRRRMQCPRS